VISIKREYPPFSILTIGLTGVLIYLLFIFSSASQVPWIGVEFDHPGNSSTDSIIIINTEAKGPAASLLKTGSEITEVRAPNGQFVKLSAIDIVVEPDDKATYSSYNEIFERQKKLYTILNSPSVTFITPELQTIEISPSPSRPLSSLPKLFWFQISCALIVLLLGLAVWAFNQRERGPFYYALAAIGLFIAITASAVYSTRELALEPELFLFLSRLNQFGAMLFSTCGTILLWHYPTKLGRFPFPLFVFLLGAAFLTANYLQLTNNLDLTVRYSILFLVLVDMALAFVQWSKTARDPVARARLKWFVFSWFTGILFYISLVFLPQIVGHKPLLHQTMAWGFFPLIYAGIAMGIIRYKLFNLDRWVLTAWYWFACGMFIVLFDAILVFSLEMTASMSLIITLAIAGWLYFPLRQRVLQQFAPTHSGDYLNTTYPTLIQAAVSSGKSPNKHWQNMLEDLFKPLEMVPITLEAKTSLIASDGLLLKVPGFNNVPAYQLRCADNGRRLFCQQDQQLANRSKELFEYVQKQQKAHSDGVEKERKRVARDLHDDVGAKLLSIVYRSQDEEVSDLARETLSELRNVMQGLESDPVTLEHATTLIREEALQRCHLFDIEFTLETFVNDQQFTLSPRAFMNIRRIIREVTTNTLKHASASRIDMLLFTTPNQLMLSISDNGRGFNPKGVSKGRGIRNINTRITELKGEIAWHGEPDHGMIMVFKLPLDSEEH